MDTLRPALLPVHQIGRYSRQVSILALAKNLPSIIDQQMPHLHRKAEARLRNLATMEEELFESLLPEWLGNLEIRLDVDDDACKRAMADGDTTKTNGGCVLESAPALAKQALGSL